MNEDELQAFRMRMREASPDELPAVLADARALVPRALASAGAGSDAHIQALTLVADALSRADQDADAADVYDTVSSLHRDAAATDDDVDHRGDALITRGLAAMSRAYAKLDVPGAFAEIDATLAASEHELGLTASATLALLELRARTRAAVLGPEELSSFDALITRVAQLGTDSESYAHALSEKARACNRADADGEAATLWRQVREIRRGARGADDPLTIGAWWELVRSLGWDGDVAASLEESEALGRALGGNHELTPDVLRWRGWLFSRTDRPADSALEYERLLALRTARGSEPDELLDDRISHARAFLDTDLPRAAELLAVVSEDAVAATGPMSVTATRARLSWLFARRDLGPDETLPRDARRFVDDAGGALGAAVARVIAQPGSGSSEIFRLATALGDAANVDYEVRDGVDAAQARTYAADLIATHVANGERTRNLREVAGDAWVALERHDEAIAEYEKLVELARADEDLPSESEALFGIAFSQRRLGRTAVAIELLERAEALAARAQRPSRVVSMMNQRALALADLGRTDEAISVMQQCVASPAGKSYRNDLAVALIHADRDAEARTLLHEIIADESSPDAATSPSGLRARGNLALATANLGDHAAALAAYEDLLAAQLSVYPPDHREVLMTRNNRALEYNRLGDHAEAVRQFREVVSERSATIGDTNPATLSSRHNLVLALEDDGNLPEALELARTVTAQRASVLGATHRLTLDSLRAVRRIMEASGIDPAAAEDVLASAPAVDEGPGVTDHRLGKHLLSSGRNAEALVKLSSAVENLENDLERLAAQRSLARAYHRLGSRKEAHDALVRAITAQQRLMPDDHGELCDLMTLDAIDLGQLGRHDEAIAASRAALAEAAQLTDDDQRLVKAQVTLGRKLSAAGQHEEALALHHDSAARLTASLGAEAPLTLESRDDVAEELLALGRVKEALVAYRTQLPLLEKVFGADSPQVRRARTHQEKALAKRPRTKEIITFAVIAAVVIALVVWNQMS